MTKTFTTSFALLAGLALSAQQPPAQPATPSQQPSEISTVISSGDIGAPPRFAVPDFIALASASARGAADAETVDAARTVARVLWDDLNFEHEFALIPRDVYKTIPPATSMFDVPLDRWREINADGVVTVEKIELVQHEPRNQKLLFHPFVARLPQADRSLPVVQQIERGLRALLDTTDENAARSVRHLQRNTPAVRYESSSSPRRTAC